MQTKCFNNPTLVSLSVGQRAPDELGSEREHHQQGAHQQETQAGPRHLPRYQGMLIF